MKSIKGKEKEREKRRKEGDFRKCLKRNKIIFETVASVLLSIMAIVVSAASVSMQKEANELQEKQAILTEQLNMPVFNVSYQYYNAYVENGISYPQGKEIEIINNGGNIINGYLYATKQIKIVIYDEIYTEIETIVIEDTGGYAKRYSYYDAQKKSFIIKKHKPTRDVELSVLIDEQLTKKYKNFVFSVYYLDYINIEYTDFKKEPHNEYYELDVGKLRKISFEEPEHYKSLHMENMTNEEILSDIEKTVEDILITN